MRILLFLSLALALPGRFSEASCSGLFSSQKAAKTASTTIPGSSRRKLPAQARILNSLPEATGVDWYFENYPGIEFVTKRGPIKKIKTRRFDYLGGVVLVPRMRIPFVRSLFRVEPNTDGWQILVPKKPAKNRKVERRHVVGVAAALFRIELLKLEHEFSTKDKLYQTWPGDYANRAADRLAEIHRRFANQLIAIEKYYPEFGEVNLPNKTKRRTMIGTTLLGILGGAYAGARVVEEVTGNADSSAAMWLGVFAIMPYGRYFPFYAENLSQKSKELRANVEALRAYLWQRVRHGLYGKWTIRKLGGISLALLLWDYAPHIPATAKQLWNLPATLRDVREHAEREIKEQVPKIIESAEEMLTVRPEDTIYALERKILYLERTIQEGEEKLKKQDPKDSEYREVEENLNYWKQEKSKAEKELGDLTSSDRPNLETSP